MDGRGISNGPILMIRFSKLSPAHTLQVEVVVLGLGLGFGLGENFVFDSKSDNRDRAVEAVESVSEARAV